MCLFQDSLPVADALELLVMVHDKTNALAKLLIDHCLAAEKGDEGQDAAALLGP
jgi:hypothetical protein